MSALPTDFSNNLLFPEDIPGEAVKDLFGLASFKIIRFAQMLIEQGEIRGLIGPRELPRLWERHLINSAVVVPFLAGQGSIADLGSGAGFPGIVLAAMLPGQEVTLIEPMQRRISWLEEVVAELELENVVLHRARAEEVDGKTFSIVTSRAVAALSKLVPLAAPLLENQGKLVFLKGRKVQEEITTARKVLLKYNFGKIDVHGITTLGSSEPTMVFTAQRELNH